MTFRDVFLLWSPKQLNSLKQFISYLEDTPGDPQAVVLTVPQGKEGGGAVLGGWNSLRD